MYVNNKKLLYRVALKQELSAQKICLKPVMNFFFTLLGQQESIKNTFSEFKGKFKISEAGGLLKHWSWNIYKQTLIS